ncbi:hypothetical protein ZWY2020_059892 [Hordeum vulgare]|nr:hypothetical protein ZWY2020_059892 [Hordeum vulgare]
MNGGGSGPALPDPDVHSVKGGVAGDPVRRLSDRLESMLPRVEALAADRARVEETNRAQHQLLEALYAGLLQAEASRERWKTAYAGLPPELQESDLVDYQAREALTDADNSQESQLKENSDDDADEMDLQQCMDNPLRGSANRPESQTSEDTDEMDLQHHMMQIFVKIHRSDFAKKERSTV